MDNGLDAQAEAEAAFFEAVQGKGGPGKFSPEEMRASDEWCLKFYGATGKMEALVRKERALAASRPDLYLN
jgi:hypothetical protein